ncbi:MATH domain-containing protein [Dichanthelium oligosanthes]|uniref:MATH domain-containing protein n=1 Tax=Dichanthelium oligosanthes TaxID=888268 RepID=A0A1E5WEE3_9POAL|nr:MATH domain-containing protein [Dichanthelium oligosanthes]
MAATPSSTDELCSDQLEVHRTRLDSLDYWDTGDEDDDCGPRPSELYGTFTWTIYNFSQIDDKELRSNSFDVGGYKWCMLIYPQGVDNASVNLSLFLCVANHDELLPGWSHFAQFTLCIVNNDTTKSKYSDTLHRFWKKEYDWGWKKFVELSKLPDGFLVDDVLTIRAQVQVIWERVDRPFRCLDEPYRRELSKVYLTNAEAIVRRFVDERRRAISKSINDERIWSRLRAFWLRTDPSARMQLTRENTGTILRVMVKHFFVEKEVPSTLLMDSLYAGLKVMKQVCKNSEETVNIQWPGEDDSWSTPMVIIDKDNDMFVLADDPILLLERVALLDSGPHQRTGDCKSSENFSKV